MSSSLTGSEMTNTEGSAGSTEKKLVISADFAGKLLHDSMMATTGSAGRIPTQFTQSTSRSAFPNQDHLASGCV